MTAMKRALFIFFLFMFTNMAFAAEIKDDIVTLMNEINRFEKSVPFFTKSKVTVFFKCDSEKFYGTYYGLYINENLVKTGQIRKETFPLNWQNFIGDFPVYGGKNVITLRLYNNNNDVSKKFEVEIPEYRRVAIELFMTNMPEKPKVVAQAWVIE